MFCCHNQSEDSVLLINEKRLVVYYDYVNKLILKYGMIETKGSIVNVDLV